MSTLIRANSCLEGETFRLAELGAAAAGIAHDINNELTLILNFLAVRNEQPGCQDQLLAATLRCSAMTSSLLDWCRGETVAPRDTDLVGLVREFAAGLRLPDTLGLHVETAAETVPALADARSLSRILTNLVQNARHAMNDSGDIWVRIFKTRILVEDSGPGIDREDRERIFQPFFSGSRKNEKARGQSRTGLGLAIVRELMVAQSGSVELVSKPGRGACFELKFTSCEEAQ